MEQVKFPDFLLDHEHNIKRLLLKKILSYRPEIRDPQSVMQDLYGVTIVECMKLQNRGMEAEKLTGAFINKAKSAWRKYEEKLTRRRPILDSYRYLYGRISFNNHGNDFEAIDLWNHLSSFLTPFENVLFTERVLYGVSYEELSQRIGKKPNTLSQQFNRIRKRLYKKLQEEAFMQPSK